jgi:tRNA modification GTPase
MTPFSTEDPIAALATPWGESAIATIRLSGSGCLALLDRLFRPSAGRSAAGVSNPSRSLATSPRRSLHHGVLHDGGEPLDDVMVAVYRRGRSYTGEEAAEISCHGGMAVVQRVLATVMSAGFRQAEPGEFTLRAFLNGRIDLTRAEAVNEIIRSKTDRARALALQRLSGGIEHRINALKARLADLRTDVEVRLDYPDEDLGEEPFGLEAIQAVEEGLEKLLATYHTGRLMQAGAAVVIAGRTNAGKSTLFNLLLREDRAIVSEHHGTTRDYIEGAIALAGIPIRLFDTAGLRASRDRLEQEGMRRTEKVIRGAHMMLFLVDATRGLEEEDRRLLGEYAELVDVLPVWNKIDAAGRKNGVPEGFLPLSAETGEGLEGLHAEVVRRLSAGHELPGDQVVIDSERQKELIEGSLAALRRCRLGAGDGLPLDLLAEDLREAVNRLGEITGEVTSEDVLRRMFSRFCVGK